MCVDGVGVNVGVLVAVDEDVAVGVGVFVGVAVFVEVGVAVFVAVGVGETPNGSASILINASFAVMYMLAYSVCPGVSPSDSTNETELFVKVPVIPPFACKTTHCWPATGVA